MVKHVGIMAAFLVASAATAAAEVRVAVNRGHVSIVAKDATVREILAEWARVGQVRVVNVERIPGAPITIQLIDVPEGQALDVLLRSISGYMAAPRQEPAAGLSMFDRVYVLPTVAGSRPLAVAAPAARQAQVVSAAPESVDDDPGAQPVPMVQAPPPRASGPGGGPQFDQALRDQQQGRPDVAFPAGAPPQGAVPSTVPGASAAFGNRITGAPGGGTPAPGMMTQPVQPQRVDPATWRPGMPTYIPPVVPGTPTARPGELGRPTAPTGGTTGPGGANTANPQ